jgi:hypothetical protein
MILVAVTNVMVYIIAKVFKENEDLRTWFYGLITTLNIFFVIGLNFISLYNSSERFDYNRIAFVIYGSLALIIVWAVSWPVYVIFKGKKYKALI